MTYGHTIRKMAQWFALADADADADADVALYAAKVTVWGRWIVWFFAAVLLAYRPGLWYPEDIEYALLNGMLATLNGVVHYRLLTNRRDARIAEALGVSMVTVRNAIYRIQNKLGVESKQEIVVWAVQNGLLDGEVGDTQPTP